MMKPPIHGSRKRISMGVSSPKITFDQTVEHQDTNPNPFKSGISMTMESPEPKAKGQ